jgi:hypothetical protein
LRAEELTESAIEPFFAVLTPSELAFFGEAVDSVCEAAVA